MSNKPKMTKNTIPENFTLSLALVDALPVLFFGGSMILIGLLFGSPLFLIGAALCFWARLRQSSIRRTCAPIGLNN
ncbi:MAG: hypothetical protein Q4A04_05205 [Eubacteriales bacterium]|nr:hypothetical protein [Eubacteriales bacterium]